MYNLGERIRQVRKWRGLSQSELEHRSGIKREYLSKLETSDLKNPTYSTLLKLSSALGIPLSSLIDTLDKPLPHNPPVIKVISAQEHVSGLRRQVDRNYCAVPIVSEELAASNPLCLAGGDIKDYALVPCSWVDTKSDPNRYRCLHLANDNRAMHPLLCCGSIICFDTHACDPYKLQRQVVVLRDRGGRVLVRHLKLGDGYLVAVPENLKEYSLHIFPLGKDNPIIGKVVWCLKQVKSCHH
jgi:transcriptional regulator with XRE-family HTH domain